MRIWGYVNPSCQVKNDLVTLTHLQTATMTEVGLVKATCNPSVNGLLRTYVIRITCDTVHVRSV
jgi:hypothetical protein